MKNALRLSIAVALASAAALAAAGTVEVVAVNPETFMDAGNTKSEEPQNIQRLSAFLVDLGARLLPADEKIRIELLDVDLAGTVKPNASPIPIRTISNRGDYPRIHVRYSVQVNGQTVRSADEWITDVDYASGIRSAAHERDALYYDKRMLEKWFNRALVQAH